MQPVDFSELWRYSDLLWILAARDIKVRYKRRARSGPGQCFSRWRDGGLHRIFRLLRRPERKIESGVPYPVYASAPFFPGSWLRARDTSSSNSLVDNQSLITKTYFPRLLIPFAAISGGLADLPSLRDHDRADAAYAGSRLGVAVVPLLVVLTVLTALVGRTVVAASERHVPGLSPHDGIPGPDLAFCDARCVSQQQAYSAAVADPLRIDPMVGSSTDFAGAAGYGGAGTMVIAFLR